MSEKLISSSILRNLSQKEYEKRKQAALEVENLVRDLRDENATDKITAVVKQLAEELASSPQANVRKGALHALAGTAIGLRQGVEDMLPVLLPAVLGAFADQDPRVRYYACESLYNIAKVARHGCVSHLSTIFDGLFKLSADTDIQAPALLLKPTLLRPTSTRTSTSTSIPVSPNSYIPIQSGLHSPQVQSAMQLLDRLMKDVVTESDSFDTDAFMPV